MPMLLHRQAILRRRRSGGGAAVTEWALMLLAYGDNLWTVARPPRNGRPHVLC
jgi:hypothetical protein